MNMKTDYPIDFVVTWVDMNDPALQNDFAKYSQKQVNEKNGVVDARFRDYGLLKFWFRAVEKFAPWVRNIYFVTSGQTPAWLEPNNPKLKLVSHKDFIPNQYLPTFNSVVIERYIHMIPGISDRFVYFNDDFYITRPITPERFFTNGLPNDIAVFQYNPSWSQWYVRIKNNIRIINRRFDKKATLKQHENLWYSKEYGSKKWMNYVMKPFGKFITLRVPHNAQPYLKATFDEVWEFAGEELLATSGNRFRSVTDYTPELFRTWQICRGNFTPYNTYGDTKMFPLLIRSREAVEAIKKQEYSLICINDHQRIKNYEQVMNDIAEAFKAILPDKSSFEK